jgi:hypothetical protein
VQPVSAATGDIATPDLSVRISGPYSTIGSASITYTVTVRNNTRTLISPDGDALVVGADVPSFIVQDAFPSATSIVGWIAPTGYSCAATVTSGPAISCNGGPLTMNSTANFYVTVKPGYAGTFSSKAIVDPYNNISEFSESNNTATFATTVATDLSIAMSATPTPAIAGQPLTYTLNVSNTGTVAAQGVGVQWHAYSITPISIASNVYGFACAFQQGAEVVDYYLNCSGGTVPAGSSVHIVFSVTPGGGVVTTINASATVDPSNVIPEINETNNSATLTTIVS